MARVAVIGLGYVGYPSALQMAKNGHDVVGVDKDEKKVSLINQGISPIHEPFVNRLHREGVHVSAKTSLEGLDPFDFYLVCVPTPVNESLEPDYSFVRNAVNATVPHLKKGSAIIVESTVNPGACEEKVLPKLKLLLEKRGLGLDDIIFAHVPERVDPGNTKYDVANISRNVGARTQQGAQIVADFYRSYVNEGDAQVDTRRSIWAAEFSKMNENCHRFINLAYVNELAMFADKMQQDIVDVIEGSSTKPFGFATYWPGCGIGGHCIPVDPYFLMDYAKAHDFELSSLENAHRINSQMPMYTIKRLDGALEQAGLKQSSDGKADYNPELQVTILGLAYKPNIDDDRMSTAYPMVHHLRAKTDIKVYDPFIRSSKRLADHYLSADLNEALEGSQAVLLATAHDEFLDPGVLDLFEKKGIKVICDGRNALDIDRIKERGFIYRGVGRGIYD